MVDVVVSGLRSQFTTQTPNPFCERQSLMTRDFRGDFLKRVLNAGLQVGKHASKYSRWSGLTCSDACRSTYSISPLGTIFDFCLYKTQEDIENVILIKVLRGV